MAVALIPVLLVESLTVTSGLRVHHSRSKTVKKAFGGRYLNVSSLLTASSLLLQTCYCWF